MSQLNEVVAQDPVESMRALVAAIGFDRARDILMGLNPVNESTVDAPLEEVPFLIDLDSVQPPLLKVLESFQAREGSTYDLNIPDSDASDDTGQLSSLGQTFDALYENNRQRPPDKRASFILSTRVGFPVHEDFLSLLKRQSMDMFDRFMSLTPV